MFEITQAKARRANSLPSHITNLFYDYKQVASCFTSLVLKILLCTSENFFSFLRSFFPSFLSSSAFFFLLLYFYSGRDTENYKKYLNVHFSALYYSGNKYISIRGKYFSLLSRRF